MAHDYFAYGINMDREHVRALCPDAEQISSAELEGYRFVIGGAGWATVVPSIGSKVHGVLWRVGDDCLRSLDQLEGVRENLYRRAKLPVTSSVGSTDAEIYLALDSSPGTPDPAYMKTIIAAAKANGAPESYLRNLEGWKSA